MRRREFIFTVFSLSIGADLAFGAKVLSTSERVLLQVKTDRGSQLSVNSGDTVELMKGELLELPINPIAFSSKLHVSFKDTVSLADSELPRISGGKYKIMGDHAEIALDVSGSFTFQFLGSDLGWSII